MKKANLISILILSSVLLTSCSDAPISGDDFISKISPNLWDFLAVFAAFIVLILIVFFFGYKPIKKLLQKRRDYVEGKINNAEQRENKSKQILSDAEKVLSNSKKEAIEIVEQAKNDALKQKEIILNQAKEETKIEKQKLKNEIAQEIESSKDEIHHQIVDVALSASEKVLNREVSKEDNSRLVDEFIKSLDKDQ